jgi:transcription antitermination factor NusG
LTAEQRPDDAGLDWYLLRTSTMREGTAEASLVEAGYVAYLPRLARWRQICARKERVERPLIPGYMFGAVARDAVPTVLCQLEGVSAVVRLDPDRAATPAPFAQIWTLLQLERMGTFDATRSKPRRELVKGDVVRIMEGEFAGQLAEFTRMRGRDRANVLIQALGRRQKLDLVLAVLEPMA